MKWINILPCDGDRYISIKRVYGRPVGTIFVMHRLTAKQAGSFYCSNHPEHNGYWVITPEDSLIIYRSGMWMGCNRPDVMNKLEKAGSKPVLEDYLRRLTK